MSVAQKLAAAVEEGGDAPQPRDPLSLRKRFREASYDGSTGQSAWEQNQAIMEQDAATRCGSQWKVWGSGASKLWLSVRVHVIMRRSITQIQAGGF